MNNKIKVLIVLMLLCIIGIVVILSNRNNKDKQDVKESQIENSTINYSHENNENTTIEGENKLISNIKVIISGKTYNAKIEENETA